VDAQDADKEKQIQAQEIQAQEIQAQEGEHDQNMEESSLAEETRMTHKKLRSLFKERRKDKENQLAALAEELKQGPNDPKDKNVSRGFSRTAQHRATDSDTSATGIRRNGCKQHTS
jgi:hypothetical protein